MEGLFYLVYFIVEDGGFIYGLVDVIVISQWCVVCWLLCRYLVGYDVVIGFVGGWDFDQLYGFFVLVVFGFDLG